MIKTIRHVFSNFIQMGLKYVLLDHLIYQYDIFLKKLLTGFHLIENGRVIFVQLKSPQAFAAGFYETP